jgi:hypothetical protein
MKSYKYAFVMMLILIFVLTSGLSFADEERHKKKIKIKVTITNITRGQVFSPPIAIAHDRHFSLFTLGETASPGLALLAEEGMPVDLISELNPDKSDYAVADGPIMPGDSESIDLYISKHSRSKLISVAGMLVGTNDAFFAVRDIWFYGKYKKVVDAAAYDAGSEINSEDCQDIPGPPCDNGFNEHPVDGAEGYVHIHAGIHGFNPEGDASSLNPAMSDWNNPVAKIRIQRIYY